MKELSPEQLLDRFSTHLRNVVAKAMALATSLNNGTVGPLHILNAFLEENGSIACEILQRYDIDRKFIFSILDKKPKLRQSPGSSPTATIPNLDAKSRKAMEKAILVAYEQGHNFVGTEHLLYGIIKISDVDLINLFKTFKIKKVEIAKEIENILASTSRFPKMEEMSDMVEQIDNMVDQPDLQQPQPPIPPLPSFKQSGKKKDFSGLRLFTINLTDKKKQKNLDPVIGREKEIERLINIISRRTKNNPVLVGEPGVGKTAIVEGLAKKITEGKIPDILKGKKILSLDLTLLIAGTIYRGEFEARLKQVIDEVARTPNAILFIDELHNIIGAGSSQGAMDAANILKPALARGNLRCIGATTIDEYKKHIKKDPALERRFQSIEIEEPTRDETIKILNGLKKYYESFHNVKIGKDAIETAVDLSIKYIHDNFLPDKAIDILDEACASVKSKRTSSTLEKKIDKTMEELEKYQDEKEEAIQSENFDKALQKKKEIEKIEKKLIDLHKQIEKTPQKTPQKITKTAIAKILQQRINISIDALLKNEWEKLSDLENEIEEHIIGQNKVVKEVIKKISQAHLGLKNEKKPLASFLFAGPSGVGKTELAKVLAKKLYHDKNSLIKLDMSEFSEQHSTSKLLGSPAGYVGHNERNRFFEKIKKKPYSIILFDEIDKAHPDVIKLLFQILDEGELTDSSGQKINFSHTIIILTTNLGSELFKSDGIGFGGDKEKKLKDLENTVSEKLKEDLSPALLNRLSSVNIFSLLDKKKIEKIIKNNVAEINQKLEKNQKIKVKLNEKALQELIKDSFNEDSGARQVEKVLTDTIHELLTEILKKNKSKKIYTLSKVKNAYRLI